jgi:hypothetical protein
MVKNCTLNIELKKKHWTVSDENGKFSLKIDNWRQMKY